VRWGAAGPLYRSLFRNRPTDLLQHTHLQVIVHEQVATQPRMALPHSQPATDILSAQVSMTHLRHDILTVVAWVCTTNKWWWWPYSSYWKCISKALGCKTFWWNSSRCKSSIYRCYTGLSKSIGSWDHKSWEVKSKLEENNHKFILTLCSKIEFFSFTWQTSELLLQTVIPHCPGEVEAEFDRK